MQAIARANRVSEGKNNGLIVDYCGILRNLRQALATFAGTSDEGRGGGEGADPIRPEEELLDELREAISIVRAFLSEDRATLDDVIDSAGFRRIAAIARAKEAANRDDETRKRFEIMCREVFRKFKACLTMTAVNEYRADYDAINIVYKMLQGDKDVADISDIIKMLHQVVDDAITIGAQPETGSIYDISKIDFDKLRREFEGSSVKHTAVQELKTVIENRLARLLAQSPLAADYQTRYEEIVAEYNAEKDRPAIEKTFEALLKFMEELNEEDGRAVALGLTSETLAIFDLLRKDDLGAADIKKIKDVAADLLETLKAEKLKIDQWREKEATRAAVRVAIQDFLYSDATGLPSPAYTESDVALKTDAVFRHVYYAYPTLPSPVYAS